jgi:dTDP-glucose 4,6-dehydratase
MKVIITGGAGFIGHHVLEHFLKNTNWDIVSFDKLTYASRGFDRIRDIEAYDNKRVTIFTGDITNPISAGVVRECADAEYILHLAAETHIDNSIIDPEPFVRSNVLGTLYMLEFAKMLKNLKAFCLFSTDEVFGPAPKGVEYKEWDRYNCTNPYSATKAGAEQLTLAYMNTYGLPGFIIHCMNVFGERQHPEKFIPLCIRKIRDGEPITIHGTPDKKRSGSRFYIHARNVAAAVHWLLDNHEQREMYNIVGEREITNLTLAQMIASFMGKELKYKIVNWHESRPGHDLRYALDGSKLKEMGYSIPITIETSLRKTVKWMLEHEEWLKNETEMCRRM